jgi:hypothetical protein
MGLKISLCFQWLAKSQSPLADNLRLKLCFSPVIISLTVSFLRPI